MNHNFRYSQAMFDILSLLADEPGKQPVAFFENWMDFFCKRMETAQTKAQFRRSLKRSLRSLAERGDVLLTKEVQNWRAGLTKNQIAALRAVEGPLPHGNPAEPILMAEITLTGRETLAKLTAAGRS